MHTLTETPEGNFVNLYVRKSIRIIECQKDLCDDFSMGKVFGKVTQYPDAGKRWTSQDEEILRNHFSQNLLMDELVKLIGRGPGGILIRLKKLELIPDDMDLNGFDVFIAERFNKRQAGRDYQISERNKMIILKEWENSNWTLEKDQRHRFLNHPTLTKLIKLDQNNVINAIKKIRLIKLDEVYGYVYGKEIEEKEHREIHKDITKLKRIAVNRLVSEIKEGKKNANSSEATKEVTRGKESFRKFGMVNPPPVLNQNLQHTSVHNCSVCKKPVIGNKCACDGW
jgi:hypothetical protein